MRRGRTLQNVQGGQARKYNYGQFLTLIIQCYLTECISRSQVSPLPSRKVQYLLKFNDLYANYLPPLFLADWMEIKTNYMIVVPPKMNFLLIPTFNTFYLSPPTPPPQPR